jgi:hypothetical protein
MSGIASNLRSNTQALISALRGSMPTLGNGIPYRDSPQDSLGAGTPTMNHSQFTPTSFTQPREMTMAMQSRQWTPPPMAAYNPSPGYGPDGKPLAQNQGQADFFRTMGLHDVNGQPIFSSSSYDPNNPQFYPGNG